MRITRTLQVLGVAFLAGAVAWSLTLAGGSRGEGPQSANATAAQQEASAVIDGVMSELAKPKADDPTLLSSNPFYVAANTPELDRIVALGTPAMNAALAKIEQSPDNGLSEYLLAICVKRISKAEMDNGPGRKSYWDTGKGFPKAWRAHLAQIPGAVRTIADSTASPEQKNADLLRLGTPAIPFVLDEIAAGHGDLSPAAETLMDGTVEMGGMSSRGIARAEWAKQNKARFAELRAMVDAAR